jgi:DUF3108-like
MANRIIYIVNFADVMAKGEYMSHRKFLVILFFPLAVVMLLACNLSGAVGSGTPAASASGACTNALYPVAEGVTWNYQLSGTVNDTIVRKINSVSGSGFEDQDTFGSGTTRTGKWNCDSGALTALDPTGGSSANVQVNSSSGDFTTTAMSGVTLPATINAGDTWSQSTTLEGTVTMNGNQAPAKNEFTSHCTVNGNESVSVPAGDFSAMKVTCQTNMIITVTVAGTSIPTPINITSVSWYAPNVGMVKSTGTGQNFDTTTVLTSYTIP